MQNVIIALSLGSAYFLFAQGLSLTWATIDVLNFGHGAIFMFSVFSCSVLLGEVELPLVGLLFVAVAVGAALSLLAQFLVFGVIAARAKDRRSAELQVLIAGVGIGSILLAIAQKNAKGTAFGLSGSSFETTTFEFFGATATNVTVIMIVTAIVLGLVVAWWLRRTRFGLALRAIGIDDEVASMMGANRSVLAAGAMAAAGALAGVAGVLFTLYATAIVPETGDVLLIKAFAVVILGGVGSTFGVAVGALALAAAEVVILTQTSGLWVDAISFGLIIAVLVLRPRGLFGKKEVQRA
jgi:branched-chain amino acid transport system permease protein